MHPFGYRFVIRANQAVPGQTPLKTKPARKSILSRAGVCVLHICVRTQLKFLRTYSPRYRKFLKFFM